VRRIGWLACLLLASGVARAAEPDLRTAVLVAGCQGCHGNAGDLAAGIPVIAQTLSRAEFTAAMKAFQGNARPASVMNRIARGYSDEELTLLAARYARAE